MSGAVVLLAQIIGLQEKLSGVEKLGWRHFSSSSYFISTETKSWEESRPGDHKHGRMTHLCLQGTGQEENLSFQGKDEDYRVMDPFFYPRGECSELHFWICEMVANPYTKVPSWLLKI